MMNKRKGSVYLYIPNIIGYIRLLLLATTVICFNNMPTVAVLSLILSGLLDACDGVSARLFNQISRFGTMLDYAIDRLSLAISMSILIVCIPKLWSLWISVLGLDLFSHFCQLYLTVFTKNQNHKENSILQFRLLNLYYNSRPVLFFTCLLHDMFFLGVFVYSIWKIKYILWLTILFAPWALFKTFIHFLQIIRAVKYSVTLDQ